MEKIDFLIIGNGGREDAIGQALDKSRRAGKIFFAPGNTGTARWGTNVPIEATDIAVLAQFAARNRLVTFVGPEMPLALGIADVFRDQNLPLVGPTKAAAKLEWDKVFALKLMRDNHIPTGWYRVFSDFAMMLEFSTTVALPIVVKNPFLAEGKGAFVCKTITAVGEAALAIKDQQKKAGQPTTLLVMEYLPGEEITITAFTDGQTLAYLHPAQDHKPIGRKTNQHSGEGDVGLMTGGMGAYAPVSLVTPQLRQEIHERIMLPTIRALAALGFPYRGVLYAQLKLTPDGPKVVEFNCRLGDPEAQVVLPLLDTDLADILLGVVNGNLADVEMRLRNEYALCLVLASGGYPAQGLYTVGQRIRGTRLAAERFGATIVHAGTARGKNHELVTTGGRVVGITICDRSIGACVAIARAAARLVRFTGSYYRHDIGNREIARTQL